VQYRVPNDRAGLIEAASWAGSDHLLERARLAIAGGDSSTMRVLPYHLPLVAARGKGARVWDVDDNESST
jgi:glutamate-1-semialdehyde aminotransferase